MYQTPLPFIGTWEQMRGGGNKKRPQKGQGSDLFDAAVVNATQLL